jgi:hypothetical protein
MPKTSCGDAEEEEQPYEFDRTQTGQILPHSDWSNPAALRLVKSCRTQTGQILPHSDWSNASGQQTPSALI